MINASALETEPGSYLVVSASIFGRYCNASDCRSCSSSPPQDGAEPVGESGGGAPHSLAELQSKKNVVGVVSAIFRSTTELLLRVRDVSPIYRFSAFSCCFLAGLKVGHRSKFSPNEGKLIQLFPRGCFLLSLPFVLISRILYFMGWMLRRSCH